MEWSNLKSQQREMNTEKKKQTNEINSEHGVCVCVCVCANGQTSKNEGARGK